MNVLKKELIELLEIIRSEKGIALYVVLMTLFVFALSLLLGRFCDSLAYLVCGWGSLACLLQIHRQTDEIRIALFKVLYLLNFTAVSLAFLFMAAK